MITFFKWLRHLRTIRGERDAWTFVNQMEQQTAYLVSSEKPPEWMYSNIEALYGWERVQEERIEKAREAFHPMPDELKILSFSEFWRETHG